MLEVPAPGDKVMALYKDGSLSSAFLYPVLIGSIQLMTPLREHEWRFGWPCHMTCGGRGLWVEELDSWAL